MSRKEEIAYYRKMREIAMMTEKGSYAVPYEQKDRIPPREHCHLYSGDVDGKRKKLTSIQKKKTSIGLFG